MREHVQLQPPGGSKPGAGLAQALGERVPRRRLPVRPDVVHVSRSERHADGVPARDSRHREGPDVGAVQALRRAVGLRRVVSSRELPELGPVGGVEREVPRRDPEVREGRRRPEERVRAEDKRVVGHVSRERSQAVPLVEFHNRARRIHAARFGVVQLQAQPRERRERPRRRERQRVLEPRARGRRRRVRRRARDAVEADEEHAHDADVLSGDAYGVDGRRVRAHARGEQQHVRPRQPPEQLRLERAGEDARGILPVLVRDGEVSRGAPAVGPRGFFTRRRRDVARG
mmetsp:Transcript_11631/g.41859  ORF Transcript_11631/g.41859 Transcript_11631/m.41859 type:complete len:287 (-) Transcript_11631:357-1217(-)